MILIHHFNLTVEEYANRGADLDVPEIDVCPYCKARTRLQHHGSYDRNAIDSERVYRIPIFRLRCPCCRKTVSLLPDFLIPYYQHTLSTIMDRLKEKVVHDHLIGVRQLVQFYVKRFLSQLPVVEMFFRHEGYREPIPQRTKEKVIRLLEMISAFGEAAFLRRSRGHFTSNFMARFAH